MFKLRRILHERLQGRAETANTPQAEGASVTTEAEAEVKAA